MACKGVTVSCQLGWKNVSKHVFLQVCVCLVGPLLNLAGTIKWRLKEADCNPKHYPKCPLV